jgi:tRNA pseudouridine38-40 synthase
VSDPGPDPLHLRATVEYDGTAFHGSQLQPDVRTVQGELESALSSLFDDPVRVELAGRTDTGVHALAQEIAFLAPAARTAADVARGLAALAPPDLSVVSVREAAPAFHPRFDARLRRYDYVVATGVLATSPFLRDRAWGLRDRPDSERLARLAARLPGERSFGGFARSGQPERGTGCRVEAAAWRRPAHDLLVFRITADRFLHHMVRYLVGTLIEIATGRRPEDDLERSLTEETPSRPVYPAPPGGLYLTGVAYDDGWNRPDALGWLAEGPPPV